MTRLRSGWIALLAFASHALWASSEPMSVEHAGVTLRGTLELPDEGEPRAVALIIAGSGPTDRNGNSPLLPGANNSLKYLAEALAARGVATLRYDKRMVGESTAPDIGEADLRFDHYADDASHLLHALRERFDGTPTLLIGHSEGGHIALTAAADSGADAVVVIAGPGQHPADLIDQQLSTQLPEPLLEQARAALGKLRAGELASDAPPQLAMLFRDSVQPYLISWFRHDPEAQAAVLDVPLLLIYGSADVQVGVQDGKLLAQAQPGATLIEIGGMNHVLKQVGDDPALAQSSYSDPDLPIDVDLVDGIDRFVDHLLTTQPR